MTEHWHWPQWTYAVILILSLLVMAAQHGDNRTGKHNAVLSLVVSLLTAWILHEGGFW